MDPIILQATKSTPAVHFDAQSSILKISGESYPENALAFYTPLKQWIQQFLGELQGSTVLQLHLTYLNTSSTRFMLMLLDQFEDAFKAGKSVEVCWYYHPDDDRSYEAGDEFREDLTVPFEILATTEPLGEEDR
ncbi:MAG TPA: DUF1987 domain-containing protein [Armatimonadota bacterium]|nr:DUF1987 domain-containing protein [Armatimonadota bacterium]